MITSRSNSCVKRIAALHHRKHRERAGLFWTEGLKIVEAALQSNCRISEIAVSEDARPDVLAAAANAEEKGITVTAYSRDCFDKISSLRHPEGIGAVIEKPRVHELPGSEARPLLVLWQLQDPGNQGSIIRSAVALGCPAVLTVEPCVDFFHPMCVRATAGAIFNLSPHSCSAASILPWLAAKKDEVIALSADGAKTFAEADSTHPPILVVGNEPHGLPADVRKQFLNIAIPMRNNVESLNAGAAAAIAMYELWGKGR